MVLLSRLSLHLAMGVAAIGIASHTVALGVPDGQPHTALLSFIEPNAGQSAPDYSHIARAAGYTAFLSADDAVFLLSAAAPTGMQRDDAPRATRATALRMRLLGAAADAAAVNGERLRGHSNYLRGNDPEGWLTGISHYAQVRFDNVYPGIDVVYSLNDGALRYDFVIAPQADAGDIRLVFDDAQSVALDGNGDVRVTSPLGELVHSAPHIYQDIDGRRQTVDGRFSIEGDGTLRFQVAAHLDDSELVIDPSITFSTYLGGGHSDGGQDVAVDDAGRIVVAGTTQSLDFPVVNALPAGLGGLADIFIARFAADGQSLDYATYIGGSGEDNPHQVALDDSGNIVVAGWTSSPDLPVVNAAQPTFQGGGGFNSDAFVLKLSPAADSLVFSTYLGGSEPVPPFFGFEWIRGMVLDAAGHIHVVGETSSSDFPATQTMDGRGCLDGEAGLVSPFIGDAFVAKLGPGGTLEYAVCIGGGDRDTGRGIALNEDGGIHIVGFSRSDDYPVTPGAYQTFFNGFYDSHVTRLNATATSIEWATFVGGSLFDFPQQIRIAPDGSSVVAGSTASDNFPTTPGVIQPQFGSQPFSFESDGFVYRLAADGSNLIFSTYLGGGGEDAAWGLELDAQGRIHLSGSTGSFDFPLLAATQSDKGGLASAIEQFGSAADAGQTLDLGQVLIDGVPRNVLASGNDGVNRLFVMDDAGVPVSTFDIGIESDDTRAIVLYDGDFDLQTDFVVTGNSGATNKVYAVNGTGGFLPPVELDATIRDTRAIVAAPLLGAPEYDLIIGNYGGPLVYHEGSVAGFGPAVSGFPFSDTFNITAVAVADLNNDFLNDVVAVTDGAAPQIWYGSAAGSFGPPVAVGAPLADAATALIVQDVNLDGLPDMIVGTRGAANRLYFGNGTGFDAVAVPLDTDATETTGLALLNVDGDDIRDIVAVGYDSGWVYLSNGAGQYTRQPLLAGADAINAVALDEFLDVYTTGPAGTQTRRLSVSPQDVFAAVLNISGTELLFSTYIGGAGRDLSNWGLELDESGNMYITGDTLASDFPTTAPLQPWAGGRGDAFLVKLDPELPAAAPGAAYITTLNLAEPTIDGITTVVFNWSVSECGSLELADYTMSLLANSELVYRDVAVTDGVLQPLGTAPRDTPVWDFNYAGLTLEQFNTGVDAVIGTPAAVGVNYLVADGISLPDDGVVNLARFEDGVFAGGVAAQLVSQNTIELYSDCDGDGFEASVDNCTGQANSDQNDSDGDGIGNRCDADLNNDCSVNPLDLGIMRSVFFTSDPDADLNGDGQVNPIDLGLMKQLFFQPPGPSGVPNICSEP